MANMFRNPSWLDPFLFPYRSLDDVPERVWNEINSRLYLNHTSPPEVSILIPAWNEELNLLRCVASLSSLKTRISFEIIVINNNSTDRTEETIRRLHVRGLSQNIQGCGPARQLGQENASGKYVLLADADCFYPAGWLDDMVHVLRDPGVACVYGRHAFIGEQGFPRWQLFLYEKLKDCVAEIRDLNRPYLNCYGMSMGYPREYGLKVGFVMSDFWGEDGKMCLGLMQYGRIVRLRKETARVWTRPRALQRDGSLKDAFLKRIKQEAKRFFHYWHSNLEGKPINRKKK